MKRYFFTVEFRLAESDSQLLAGRCIAILHGFLKEQRWNGIGVSFPHWSREFLGRSIGFVGVDYDQLLFLREQPYFENMSLGGFFEISEVKTVPDGLEEVRFVRNQAVAKCFAGEKRRRLDRAKRRAEARGEVFDPTQLCYDREVDHFHRAVMASQSNGQRFVLHIQKQHVNDSLSVEFNNYGLATNNELQGTVPELATVV